MEAFEHMLKGGHHNSLGRTIEVVDIVLKNQPRLNELCNCYYSQDGTVRLRTSNAMKRICKEQPNWLIPLLDGLTHDISKIEQASTQWTLAHLFGELYKYMNPEQIKSATEVMKHNLANQQDWIVLNTTMQTLYDWSHDQKDLKQWIKPHLDKMALDKRKSVAKRAQKLSSKL